MNTFMNFTQKARITWLKQGLTITLVLSCIFLNVSAVTAATSSSSASSASSATAVSSGSGSASAAAASSASASAASTDDGSAAAAAAASSAAAASADDDGSAAAAASSAAAAAASSNDDSSAAAAAAAASSGSGTATASAGSSAAASASTDSSSASASSASSASASTNTNTSSSGTGLAVSCSASASSVSSGTRVTYTAHVNGGFGNYNYSWSGSNGLSGNSQTISKTYTDSGSKTATVHVTSGSSSASATCQTSVDTNNPPSTCPNNSTLTASEALAARQNGTLEIFFTNWGHENGVSKVRIANHTGKKLPVSFISYKVFGNNLSDQQYFDGGSVTTVDGCETVDLTVNIPACWSQVDVYYGAGPHVLHDNQSNGTTLYSTEYNRNISCTNNPPSNPPSGGGGGGGSTRSLDARCDANRSSAYVGDRITWSATNVHGGSGNYTYSWSGTDGLYSRSRSVTETYDRPGTKYATVTVRSGSRSVTRTCSVYVNNRYAVPTYTNPTYYPPSYVTPTYQPNYNGVSLSQVPYTGLESNIKIILFTLALIAWSGIVTYIVIVRRRNAAQLAMAEVAGSAFAGETASAASDAVTSDEAQQVARQEILMGYDNMLSNLESFARSQNVLISTDALAAVADLAGNDLGRAQTLLSSLAHQYATSQDWTTLDLNKVQNTIS